MNNTPNNTCSASCGGDEPQSIQSALEIIGDKWTALILRMLHEKDMRFTDFRERIPELNPRTLTQRLAMLEGHEIVRKQHFEEPSSCSKYVLTDKGRGLDEVIHSMALWGKKYGNPEAQAS